MKRRSIPARMLAFALAAVFGVALSAQPVAAATRPAPTPSPKAPLASAAAARVAALTPAQLDSVSAQVTDTALSTSSPAFFKTGKGIAVLVLMVAGVGFAAYKAVDDRDPVKSPIR